MSKFSNINLVQVYVTNGKEKFPKLAKKNKTMHLNIKDIVREMV